MRSNFLPALSLIDENSLKTLSAPPPTNSVNEPIWLSTKLGSLINGSRKRPKYFCGNAALLCARAIVVREAAPRSADMNDAYKKKPKKPLKRLLGKPAFFLLGTAVTIQPEQMWRHCNPPRRKSKWRVGKRPLDQSPPRLPFFHSSILP